MLGHVLLSNLGADIAGMVVGHSTDFAGIDMSLHGVPIFLGLGLSLVVCGSFTKPVQLIIAWHSPTPKNLY